MSKKEKQRKAREYWEGFMAGLASTVGDKYPPEIVRVFAQCYLVVASFGDDERQLFQTVYDARDRASPEGLRQAQDLCANNPGLGTIIRNIFSDDKLTQLECVFIRGIIQDGQETIHRIQGELAGIGITVDDVMDVIG